LSSQSAVKAGVVGLGLMGTSITACLLAAGHEVVGIDKDAAVRGKLRRRISELLVEMSREKLLRGRPNRLVSRLEVAKDVSGLKDCGIVIEAVREDLEIKRATLRNIEQEVSPDTIIGSNTSALPITKLQSGAKHPQRIFGIHWGEPAHVTRFMEVICGDQSSPEIADKIVAMARQWRKEPTLVKRDIRGFITNRVMYAMIREAFHLVEGGYATPADVDRSLRNDLGYWITFAGPFRFMDLTGIPTYAAVMQDLMPELDNSAQLPELMRQVVASGAKGVANSRGFYRYTPRQSKEWQRRFLEFTYDIRQLAGKYPEDVGDKPSKATKPKRKRRP